MARRKTSKHAGLFNPPSSPEDWREAQNINLEFQLFQQFLNHVQSQLPENVSFSFAFDRRTKQFLVFSNEKKGSRAKSFGLSVIAPDYLALSNLITEQMNELVKGRITFEEAANSIAKSIEKAFGFEIKYKPQMFKPQVTEDSEKVLPHDKKKTTPHR